MSSGLRYETGRDMPPGMGSEGSAASGGSSDLSEWQRSADNEGVRTEETAGLPQQEKKVAVQIVKQLQAAAPAADPAPLPVAGCNPKRTIDAAELWDLKECLEWDKGEFPKALAEYTGIVAKPYTAFQYYHENGDYIGDSDYYSIEDVLKEAGIEVADDA